ncbi:NAD-dependent epimerase/dehydratase family protein [Mycolicibacterium sp. 018/SC-01/001]|uniref:NAD-dependent epimerase/dehydratase family protein n=1 Tax=Mycolicibacterium sp. 018/SC-01/001 TaxID=2592069 RepID=UPI0011807CBB|nr:NAD-dependent epimerase/dehydratase family protein [Mycolicibacterium sp. 018/SC-01/001]TRW80496.1 NAD-dependent epimerase/dehydratase family protein [Mycolicibacterium sp. 018/SC-01/001]
MSAVGEGATIAVTGATGFVGVALVHELVDAGYRVVGISERLQPPDAIRDILSEYIATDLTSAWPAINAVDAIVHLAGLAAVGPSFTEPQRYIECNSRMVTNMFEHMLSHAWHGRIVVVSSGAVYTNAEGRAPLSEDDECAATSPYVVSKLLLENQTDYYRRLGGDAVVARPFNHIGPGQSRGFIVPDLTAAVLKSGPGETIEVGNLNTARDYTDVRDVARAYRLLLEHRQLRHGVYNVCSGKALDGWDVLMTICDVLDVAVPPVLAHDARALDSAFTVGSSERLTNETGWRPEVSIRQSIADFVLDQQLLEAGILEKR